MNWYRVAIREDGRVESVTQVEGTGDSQLRVFYVRAKSESEAVKRTKALRKNQRRAELKELGICVDCRKPAKVGYTLCFDCLQKSNERWAERRDGTFKRKTHEELSVIHSKRHRGSQERLVTLLEVRKAWERSRTVKDFARWLAHEIVDAGGEKEQPKLRENSGDEAAMGLTG